MSSFLTKSTMSLIRLIVKLQRAIHSDTFIGAHPFPIISRETATTIFYYTRSLRIFLVIIYLFFIFKFSQIVELLMSYEKEYIVSTGV